MPVVNLDSMTYTTFGQVPAQVLPNCLDPCLNKCLLIIITGLPLSGSFPSPHRTQHDDPYQQERQRVDQVERVSQGLHDAQADERHAGQFLRTIQ